MNKDNKVTFWRIVGIIISATLGYALGHLAGVLIGVNAHIIGMAFADSNPLTR